MQLAERVERPKLDAANPKCDAEVRSLMHAHAGGRGGGTVLAACEQNELHLPFTQLVFRAPS